MNEKSIALTSILVKELGLTEGDVIIPETFIKDSIIYKITEIEEFAFFNYRCLTSVNIPNSVTSIREGIFCNCSSLTSINIPNSVINIEEYAFGNCYDLESINIPNSVTIIAENAFYNIPHIEYYGTAEGSPWGALSMN